IGRAWDVVWDEVSGSVIWVGITDTAALAGDLTGSALQCAVIDPAKWLWNKLCSMLSLEEFALKEEQLPPMPKVVPFANENEVKAARSRMKA
ncbi:MAG: hypothetical protein J6Y13_00475, partial [Treponema sp.]|nr:hypothetical protein [Treponema sp.]